MNRDRISLIELLHTLQRERLIELSPRDVLRCEQLFATGEPWTAASIAGLFATSPESWTAIHGRVNALAGGPRSLRPVGAVQDATRAQAELREQPERPVLVAEPPRTDVSHRLAAWLRGLPGRLRRRAQRVSGSTWAAIIALSASLGVALLLLAQSPEPTSEYVDAGPNIDAGPSIDAGPGHDASPGGDAGLVLVRGIQASQTLSRSEQVSLNSVGSAAGWLQVVGLGLLTALLAMLAARWLLLPRQQHAVNAARPARMSEHKRAALQASRDQPMGVPYHVPRSPPFAETTMDDAATILARVRERAAGARLDVVGTIDRTIESAGSLELAFVDTLHPIPVLALVDVERGDHPFLDGVTWVIERWQRTGLPVERYDFAYKPDPLSPHQGQQSSTRSAQVHSLGLDELARRKHGAPLLLFSRFLHPEASHGHLPWLAHLSDWPGCVLIDLDPRPVEQRPSHVPPALRAWADAGFARVPFTAEGLLRAAELCADHHRRAEQPQLTMSLAPMSQLEQHLARWAACAAYVPDPSWNQLEAIRLHFPELSRALPHRAHAQTLIDWLSSQPESQVPGQPETEGQHQLIIADQLRDRLIEEQRAADPSLERRARLLLMDQLRGAAETPMSAISRERLALKLAFHEAVLHPERAEALLARFSADDSPVAQDLATLLRQEIGLQTERQAVLTPWPEAVMETATAWVDDSQATRDVRVPARYLFGRAQRLGGKHSLMFAFAVAISFVLLSWWLSLLGDVVVEQPLPDNYTAPAVSEIIDNRPVAQDGAEPDAGTEPDVENEDRPRIIAAATSLRPALVSLPGGLFQMGSERPGADSDEKPVHWVQVSAFAMCQTEVTRAQWQAVMGSERSSCTGDCDDKPVTDVSWFDAIDYMNRLSEREQLSQCYQRTGDKVRWRDECQGYRLPTEAEWEYAARAGSTTAYGFGDSELELKRYAWFADNSGDELHDVATREPNSWLLNDMHGNVWEWVWDWKAPYRAASRDEAERDPRGPYDGDPAIEELLKREDSRAWRGGGFYDEARYLRSAERVWSGPANQLRYNGFRCARGVPPALGD